MTSVQASIPRNSMGWPCIEPNQMTYAQLLHEAKRWGGNHVGGTVGAEERKKYAEELLRRGFSSKVEYQEGILPDEVPGEAAANRHRMWSIGETTGELRR